MEEYGKMADLSSRGSEDIEIMLFAAFLAVCFSEESGQQTTRIS